MYKTGYKNVVHHKKSGSLWFLTYPVGADNGYDPESTIEEYGDGHSGEAILTEILNFFVK